MTDSWVYGRVDVLDGWTSWVNGWLDDERLDDWMAGWMAGSIIRVLDG